MVRNVIRVSMRDVAPRLASCDVHRQVEARQKQPLIKMEHGWTPMDTRHGDDNNGFLEANSAQTPAVNFYNR
jgi:hypothetical protein